MEINIDSKLAEHFERVEELAKTAIEDDDESYSSRASAQSALTTIIKDIVKSQESIITMKRLQEVERILIKTVKKYLNDKEMEEFLAEINEIQ